MGSGCKLIEIARNQQTALYVEEGARFPIKAVIMTMNTHIDPPVQAETATGRSAWVTGASSGIGRALALRLAGEGWSVAVSARDAQALATLVAEAPNRIHVFPLDVTDAKAAVDTLSAIESRIGPLDLAVLNAGTYQHDSVSTFDVQMFRSTIDVNLMGSVHCLAAIMPRMTARRAGQIAVVASVVGYVGLPGAAAYGASKAALINMCQALYPELEAQGVRLSLICPGFVDTALTRKNDFPMPFVIPVDEAVDHIVKGLRSRHFEIAFPWKMVLSMKLLARLPTALYFSITRRIQS